MKERTVRAGDEELFKSRAREKGKVKIIDLLRARLDAKSRRLQGRAAEPPAQRHPHLRRARERARPDAHRRLLRRGHPRVHRRARPASRAGSRSASSRCGRSRCRRATRSTRSSQGASHFTLDQWRDLLLRSVGFEPARFTPRAAGHPARPHGPVRRARTTTPSSSAPAAPASRTCSSRSRRTPISSRAARRRSPTCS